jgi:hypothetical protein
MDPLDATGHPRVDVMQLKQLALAWFVCAACGGDASMTPPPPIPDRALFDTAIYPLLLRDCGFSECHGAEQRFFQVFGPGRSRLEGHPTDPDLGPRERQLSYDRARSMLVAATGGSIFESPLLTKPLEVKAGGASHQGVDRFGRNLFQTTQDPRYLALWQWATTQQPMAAPTNTLPFAGTGATVPVTAPQDSAGGGAAGMGTLNGSFAGAP